MQSSLIGKLEKAKRYAQEPERVSFETFQVNFRGDNDAHTVRFGEGSWHCSCGYFAEGARCSHTMALEKILEPMLAQVSSGAIAI